MTVTVRALGFLAGLAFVGACTGPSAPPSRSVSLFQGAITARSPAGYCVDPQVSRPHTGFVVMAPCATMGTADPSPAVVGVATLQVGAAASGAVAGAEAALRDLLLSDAGAGLLSANGDAGSIKVLSSDVHDNSVIVHFVDSAPPQIEGLQPEEWRAFLDLDGRLVTVAVRGLADAPLGNTSGARLLDQVVAGLVSAPAAGS